MASSCDVVVVGAGPYGLAAAAHLRSPGALDVRVVGETMSFWERHMPPGMLLRSPWVASSISDPDRAMTLDDYERAVRRRIARVVPLTDFVAYGRWFANESAARVDSRSVVELERSNGGFRVRLDDGDELVPARVVVAAGIAPFAWIPPEFANLQPELATHAARALDFGSLVGRRVAVVGGGQSALETAALLHEAGASVEVLVRAQSVHWLERSARLHRLGPLTRLLYSPTDVGPAGVSRVVAAPGLVQPLPRAVQDWMGTRSTRPAGAAWLIPRLRDVPITVDRSIVSARQVGDGVELKLSDGGVTRVDRVLLGTGYNVDIARYSFLDRRLLGAIRRVNGFPDLTRGFEASVPGLHFVGAPAAWTYGPLMRFVAGTRYTATSIARTILADRAPAALSCRRRAASEMRSIRRRRGHTA